MLAAIKVLEMTAIGMQVRTGLAGEDAGSGADGYGSGPFMPVVEMQEKAIDRLARNSEGYGSKLF